MYDINTKNVKKGKNIFYIFLLLGFIFFIIIFGILISSIIKLKSLDATTLSTRVDIKSHIDDDGAKMYSPIYYYEVNGIEYSCPSSGSSSVRPSTDNKIVYYDSKNPSECMSEYSKSSNLILLIFLLLPIIFIVVSIINIIKINKRVKAINELNQKGKLIKNLPYRLENTGTVINGVHIQRPVVDYTLSNGMVVQLYGDPRNDKRLFDADGMVDLLIDESNPENYYIDLEINRLTGNLPGDYSSVNNQLQQSNQNIINGQSQNINPLN